MPGLRPPRRSTLRSSLVLLAALACVGVALAVIGHLQSAASGSRDAESALLSLRLDLMQLRDVPWDAQPGSGVTAAETRGELADAIAKAQASFARLERSPGLAERSSILGHFRRGTSALWQLLAALTRDDQDGANAAADAAARQLYAADGAMQQAAKAYRAQASRTLLETRTGTVAIVLSLFCAFGWFYLRAHRRRRAAEALAAENRRLLHASRTEALTDGLTGLWNRRALLADLERASGSSESHLLVLFDLDGFKHYNDSFGHPAGDALLARLGGRLRSTIAGIGTPYRIGGDEFCVLARTDGEEADAVAPLAASALSEAGEAFAIGCSYGTALMPADTSNPNQALLLADRRMYERKRSSRVSASRQSADVLLQLLAERNHDLGRHTADVAALADLTAERLDLDDAERARIRLAAELHDVGKAAIPDSILMKPAALDEEEWLFVRRHAAIGERIVAAAPALAHAAALVRSHHERFDGLGYPDRVGGGQVLLGARIIAVADAFDAMTSDRPYRGARAFGEAVDELRRCAGTQFDPQVVDAFLTVIADPDVRRQIVGRWGEQKAA